MLACSGSGTCDVTVHLIREIIEGCVTEGGIVPASSWPPQVQDCLNQNDPVCSYPAGSFDYNMDGRTKCVRKGVCNSEASGSVGTDINGFEIGYLWGSDFAFCNPASLVDSVELENIVRSVTVNSFPGSGNNEPDDLVTFILQTCPAAIKVTVCEEADTLSTCQYPSSCDLGFETDPTDSSWTNASASGLPLAMTSEVPWIRLEGLIDPLLSQVTFTALDGETWSASPRGGFLMPTGDRNKIFARFDADAVTPIDWNSVAAVIDGSVTIDSSTSPAQMTVGSSGHPWSVRLSATSSAGEEFGYSVDSPEDIQIVLDTHLRTWSVNQTMSTAVGTVDMVLFGQITEVP